MKNLRPASGHATLVVMLAVFVAAAPLRAADDAPLDKARQLYLDGHWAESAEEFAKLSDKDPAAALGLARCQNAVGERDQAAQTLKKAFKEHPKFAALPAELALLALERGDHAAVLAHADEALKLEQDQVVAHWAQAELLREQGKLKEADQAYKWFVDYYNKHEIDDPDTLRYIGLASAEFARWNRLSDQFGFLVNELFPDALELNKDYWPAHYETGRLFLEKYNLAEATKSLKAALALNPHAAEIHAALAALALQGYNLTEASNSLDRALEINPKLIQAHQLRADIHLANFEAQKALEVIKGAVLLHPTNEATLGRIAASYAAIDGLKGSVVDPDSRCGKMVAEAIQRNEHCGAFFMALADGLDRVRRWPAAAHYYQEAATRMPQLTEAAGQCGLMLMRLGEEDRASKLLKESFEIDPFNVRVSNTLKVLEVLEEYETLETAHFIIKFDPKYDKILARYAAEWLEELYPQLCKQLGYEPPEKSLFEIFNRARNTDAHGWFSARMVGLPDIHTIGACAGKMVAMQSPTDGKQGFNWARVLKHEFVHVVNLQQTNFNIPHWYTEALATLNEGSPRPQTWNEQLVERAKQKKLFNLETINFGFIRPKSGEDWNMAYCQAELYAEFMLKEYGDDALARMLTAYADNLTTPEAIRRSFQVEPAEFEKKYSEYVQGIVEGLTPKSAAKERSIGELQQAIEDNPQDVDALAQMARVYMVRKSYPEARKHADAALKLESKHQLASYVRARLHLLIGENQEALNLLEGSLDKHAPQPDLLALLAGLRLRSEDFVKAAELYDLGAKHDPSSTKWTKSLAAVYLKSGNTEKLLPVLVRLADEDPDDLNLRKKLAQLYLDAKDYPNAVKYARESLQVDVLDPEVHQLLGDALAGAGDKAGAEKEHAVAKELEAGKE